MFMLHLPIETNRLKYARQINKFTKIFISVEKNLSKMEWKTVLWKWSTLQGLVKQEMFIGNKPYTLKILLNPNKKAEKLFCHVGWLHVLYGLDASCIILILFSLCL